MSEHEIMTLEEVAKLLRVSERTIYDWANKGELPGGKLGTSWRFKRKEIERWVDRRLSATKESSTGASLNLADSITRERALVLSCTKKAEALAALVDALKTAPQIKEPEELAAAFYQREELMSTGIGLGVAIPHVRLASVEDLVLALGVSREGIDDYEALDGQPVHLIFMIAAGNNQHAEYLRMLSGISKRIKNEDFRKALIEAKDAEELLSVLNEKG